MIIIRDIKLPKDDKSLLEKKLKKLTRLENLDYEIYRKSIDARKGINFVYQVIIKNDISPKGIKNADNYEQEDFNVAVNVKNTNNIIVGSGPAGLFCGYILSKYGQKVKIIERGESIDDRIATIENFLQTGELNLNSNVQFGEGGAGTFSDGKLTARSKDKRVREVLKILYENGASEDILYDAKPHIGTDVLREVIKNIRNKIIENGGEILFNTTFLDFESDGSKVKKFLADKDEFDGDNFILGLGNSSRDSFLTLSKKIEMENKPFAVGFRIEHIQRDIDRNQYKVEDNLIDKLPRASYNLTYNNKNLGLGAYTFCMCPGGYVVNGSSESEKLCVNGMSFHKRDGKNANSALIVTVNEKIYGKKLLDGMRFQQNLESKAFILGGKNYSVPVQKFSDFLENRETTHFGTIFPSTRKYKMSNLRGIYPKIVEDMIIEAIFSMDKKLKGFASKDSILSGVETRSSSPIRMKRDENLNSLGYENLYVIGEGSGYSGGIVSSAIDGIKAAENILRGKKC